MPALPRRGGWDGDGGANYGSFSRGSAQTYDGTLLGSESTYILTLGFVQRNEEGHEKRLFHPLRSISVTTAESDRDEILDWFNSRWKVCGRPSHVESAFEGTDTVICFREPHWSRVFRNMDLSLLGHQGSTALALPQPFSEMHLTRWHSNQESHSLGVDPHGSLNLSGVVQFHMIQTP
ncbi:hypothetical protein STEG23_021353 [Scotinomys teguina]